MRNRLILILPFAVLAATPAWAQRPQPPMQPPQAAQPQNPCLSDPLRCQLSVDDQRIGEIDRLLRQTETDRVMARNQLILLQKHETDLAEWFKGWFGGDKPADPPPK